MSNIIIAPSTFRDALAIVLDEYRSQLCETWNSKSCYTKIWTKSGGILETLGNRLGLPHCHRQYWSIDAVYYARPDTENFAAGTCCYAESLAIALEHENDPTSAHVEINKLSIIDAPLKVLITYASPGDFAVELLAKFSRILTRANTFGDFATHRKHLVVFGWKNGTQIEWAFYVFDGESFTAISGA